MSRAPRPAGVTPASHERVAGRLGATSLGAAISSPVLAGVAGAGDAHLDAVVVEASPRGSAAPRANRGVDAGDALARAGTLDRQHAAFVGHVDAGQRGGHARRCSTRWASRRTASSPTHHTMMSSTTKPSSFEQVRVLGAARRDSRQVVGQRRLERVEHPGAVTAHGAQVADVEDDRVAPAGQVLGDGARRVRQGHLPARRRGPSWPRAPRGGRRGKAAGRSRGPC